MLIQPSRGIIKSFLGTVGSGQYTKLHSTGRLVVCVANNSTTVFNAQFPGKKLTISNSGLSRVYLPYNSSLDNDLSQKNVVICYYDGSNTKSVVVKIQSNHDVSSTEIHSISGNYTNEQVLVLKGGNIIFTPPKTGPAGARTVLEKYDFSGTKTNIYPGLQFDSLLTSNGDTNNTLVGHASGTYIVTRINHSAGLVVTSYNRSITTSPANSGIESIGFSADNRPLIQYSVPDGPYQSFRIAALNSSTTYSWVSPFWVGIGNNGMTNLIIGYPKGQLTRITNDISLQPKVLGYVSSTSSYYSSIYNVSDFSYNSIANPTNHGASNRVSTAWNLNTGESYNNQTENTILKTKLSRSTTISNASIPSGNNSFSTISSETVKDYTSNKPLYDKTNNGIAMIDLLGPTQNSNYGTPLSNKGEIMVNPENNYVFLQDQTIHFFIKNTFNYKKILNPVPNSSIVPSNASELNAGRVAGSWSKNNTTELRTFLFLTKDASNVFRLVMVKI